MKVVKFMCDVDGCERESDRPGEGPNDKDLCNTHMCDLRCMQEHLLAGFDILLVSPNILLPQTFEVTEKQVARIRRTKR